MNIRKTIKSLTTGLPSTDNIQSGMQNALIVDVHNLLFIVAYSKAAEDENQLLTIFLNELIEYNKQFNNPTPVILCFESGSNWRKEYTQTHNILKQYKANRTRNRDNLLKELVYKTSDILYEVLQDTSVCCMKLTEFEGDDIIAESAMQLSPTHNVIILSTDNDFKQLLRFPNIQIFDIVKRKLKEEEDPHYFMFLKCIRGDSGDNVPSAFPRVRETIIQEAYVDDQKCVMLYNTEWVDKVTNRSFVVKDCVRHNEILMDLTKQPNNLKVKLKTYVSLKLQQEYKMLNFLSLSRVLAKSGITKAASDAGMLDTVMQKVHKGEYRDVILTTEEEYDE